MHIEYFDHPLCLDPATGPTIEGLQATWAIIDGGAMLERFWIGSYIGERYDAILMTGADHIARQERIVSDAWAEWSREDSFSRRCDDMAAE